MAQSRFFSSVAQPTTLAANITSASTAIQVVAAIGFPVSLPFTIALDYGNSLEELCDVTAVAGTTFTVTRATDGTSAAAHNIGAVVRHVSSARDFNEDNAHVNSSQGVHGIAGISSVVGTTDAQTLTNKTLASPIFTGSIPSFVLGNTNAAATVVLELDASPTQTANTLITRDQAGLIVLSLGPKGDLFLAPSVAVPPNSSYFTISPQVAVTGLGSTNLMNLVGGSSSTGRVQVKADGSQSIALDSTSTHAGLSVDASAVATIGGVVVTMGANTGSAFHSTNSGGGAFDVLGNGVVTVTGSAAVAANLVTSNASATVSGSAFFGQNGNSSPVFTGFNGTSNTFVVLGNGNTTISGNLTVAGIGAVVANYKSSNETRTSTVALSNDAALLAALTVGTWVIDSYIEYNGAVTPSDIKSQLTFSGTAGTASFQFLAPVIGTVTSAAFGQMGLATPVSNGTFGVGSLIGARLNGTIVVTGAGTLNFQWAQNTSSATATTIMASSYFKATRIA
jgi:hypothetical protein